MGGSGVAVFLLILVGRIRASACFTAQKYSQRPRWNRSTYTEKVAATPSAGPVHASCAQRDGWGRVGWTDNPEEVVPVAMGQREGKLDHAQGGNLVQDSSLREGWREIKHRTDHQGLARGDVEYQARRSNSLDCRLLRPGGPDAWSDEQGFGGRDLLGPRRYSSVGHAGDRRLGWRYVEGSTITVAQERRTIQLKDMWTSSVSGGQNPTSPEALHAGGTQTEPDESKSEPLHETPTIVLCDEIPQTVDMTIPVVDNTLGSRGPEGINQPPEKEEFRSDLSDVLSTMDQEDSSESGYTLGESVEGKRRKLNVIREESFTKSDKPEKAVVKKEGHCEDAQDKSPGVGSDGDTVSNVQIDSNGNPLKQVSNSEGGNIQGTICEGQGEVQGVEVETDTSESLKTGLEDVRLRQTERHERYVMEQKGKKIIPHKIKLDDSVSVKADSKHVGQKLSEDHDGQRLEGLQVEECNKDEKFDLEVVKACETHGPKLQTMEQVQEPEEGEYQKLTATKQTESEGQTEKESEGHNNQKVDIKGLQEMNQEVCVLQKVECEGKAAGSVNDEAERSQAEMEPVKLKSQEGQEFGGEVCMTKPETGQGSQMEGQERSPQNQSRLSREGHTQPTVRDKNRTVVGETALLKEVQERKPVGQESEPTSSKAMDKSRVPYLDTVGLLSEAEIQGGHIFQVEGPGAEVEGPNRKKLEGAGHTVLIEGMVDPEVYDENPETRTSDPNNGRVLSENREENEGVVRERMGVREAPEGAECEVVSSEESLNKDPKVEENLNKEPKLEESLNKEPKLEENLNKDPKLEENLNKEPKLEENLNKDPKLEENLNKEPKLEENLNKDPKLEENLNKEPKLEENLNKDPKVEESLNKDPKLEENLNKEPKLEENLNKEPKLEENLNKEPKLEENLNKEPKLEENLNKEPTIEENLIKEPKIEEKLNQEHKIEENLKKEPKIENLNNEPKIEGNLNKELKRKDNLNKEPKIEDILNQEPKIENVNKEPKIEGNLDKERKIEELQVKIPEPVDNQEGRVICGHDQSIPDSKDPRGVSSSPTQGQIYVGVDGTDADTVITSKVLMDNFEAIASDAHSKKPVDDVSINKSEKRMINDPIEYPSEENLATSEQGTVVTLTGSHITSSINQTGENNINDAARNGSIELKKCHGTTAGAFSVSEIPPINVTCKGVDGREPASVFVDQAYEDVLVGVRRAIERQLMAAPHGRIEEPDTKSPSPKEDGSGSLIGENGSPTRGRWMCVMATGPSEKHTEDNVISVPNQENAGVSANNMPWDCEKALGGTDTTYKECSLLGEDADPLLINLLRNASSQVKQEDPNKDMNIGDQERTGTFDIVLSPPIESFYRVQTTEAPVLYDSQSHGSSEGASRPAGTDSGTDSGTTGRSHLLPPVQRDTRRKSPPTPPPRRFPPLPKPGPLKSAIRPSVYPGDQVKEIKKKRVSFGDISTTLESPQTGPPKLGVTVSPSLGDTLLPPADCTQTTQVDQDKIRKEFLSISSWCIVLVKQNTRGENKNR